jgi:hypothetical protein
VLKYSDKPAPTRHPSSSSSTAARSTWSCNTRAAARPRRRLRDPRGGGRRRHRRSSRRSPSSRPRSPRSARCAAGFEVTSLQEYGVRERASTAAHA